MFRASRILIPMIAIALALPLANSHAAEPVKATGTIKGKVVKEDGTAAAEVEVRVMAAPAAREKKPKIQDAKPAPARREAVATAKTDAEGKFSLSVPAGDYVIQAGARKGDMGRAKVTVADGQTVEVTVSLKAAGTAGEKKPQK